MMEHPTSVLFFASQMMNHVAKCGANAILGISMAVALAGAHASVLVREFYFNLIGTSSL